MNEASSATVDGPRLWGEAAAAVAAAFALFFLALTPFYESNDDVAIQWIADGRLYDEPSALLVYQSVLIGQALSALYRLAPGLPWYPLYLYSCHALAWLLIARGLLAASPRPRAALLFAIAFLAVGAPLMAWLQFSSTALLLGLAGAACYALTDRETGPRPYGTAVIAGFALALSGVVRIYYTLAASLAFVAPLLLFALLKRRRFKRFAAFALSAGLTSGAAALCDQQVYGQPEWRRWLAIHKASHEINKPPLPDAPERDAALARIGWSRNDLALAHALYRSQGLLSDLDRLEEAAAITRRHRPRPALTHTAAKLARRLYAKHARELLAIAALLALALLLAWTDGRRREAFCLLAFLLYWLFGLIAIAHIFERLPTRVLRPTFLAPIFAAFLIIERQERKRGPWLRRDFIALALVAVIAGLSQARRLRAAAAAFQGNRERALADLERLKGLGEDALLIKCGQLGLSYLPVFGEAPRLKFIMLGWSVASPPWRAKLARHGIADLSRALVRREDLYLLAPPRFEELMKVHMRERYGLAVETDAVLELNGGDLRAFKLRRVK